MTCIINHQCSHFRKLLEQVWNDKKSVKTNLKRMGLAADPNLAVRGRIKIDESSSVSNFFFFFPVRNSTFILCE